MKIYQIAESIRNGTLSSFELASQYISKIEANKRLDVIIELNPDALGIAKRLDAANIAASCQVYRNNLLCLCR